MQSIILNIAALVICISVHESAHALMSCILGDKTAKNMGRISLNPVDHLDFLGTISFVLLGFGWGKPVPVNYSNLKKPKRDMMLISVAGPLSNVLLAILFGCISILVLQINHEFAYSVAQFTSYITMTSVVLGVFNMLPIPPLDGSKVIIPLFSKKVQYFIMQNAQYIQFVMILAIYFGVLSTPIMFLSNYVYEFVYWVVFKILFFI